MASIIDPSAARTWVAIDIAKGWNVALVEHANGRQQRFRFRHCREDYDGLVWLLQAAAEPCRIALEPTADYHRTLAYRLVAEGFDLVLVSSVAGARMREAVFNSWDKNDPKDAAIILRLLKQGMTQRYCDPMLMHTHDLQELRRPTTTSPGLAHGYRTSWSLITSRCTGPRSSASGRPRATSGSFAY